MCVCAALLLAVARDLTAASSRAALVLYVMASLGAARRAAALPRRNARSNDNTRRQQPRRSRGARRAATLASQGYKLETYFAWLLKQERASGNHLDGDLALVLSSVASACKRVSALVAAAPIAGNTGEAGSTNMTGEEQKKLDVLANEVFCECVASSGRTGVVVTEEEDVPVALEATSGNYVVTFDPIDGSSNIDACVTTGSIFGIYSAGECAIDPADSPEQALEKCMLNTRRSGEELVAAGYCMYSSSCVLVLTVGDGVYGFTLDREIGEFLLSHDNLRIPEANAMYSCNLGNTALWAPQLAEYAAELQRQNYTYRYIGALVGDFHRTLLYGGLWLYPPDSKAPEGKARLLYEVAPIGMLAEQAGGMATYGDRAEKRVLDAVPTSTHQKHPMFVGSPREVEKLQQFLSEAA